MKTHVTWGSAFGAIALLTIANTVVLASHFFSDVDTSNPHHDDIGAIAGAGITTGCGPGVYCPEDNVTRQQMASFLRRGLGRVTHDVLEPQSSTISGPFTFSWTHQLTPGLPAGALAGAAGFIKLDAVVIVNGRSDFDCLVHVSGFIDNTQVTRTYRAIVPAGGKMLFPLTGARAVTSPGPKTIEVRVDDAFPCGFMSAEGDATSSYFPFGSTGGNTL